MPKVKIVCLILATVLASVGTLLVITNLGGGEIPPLDVPDGDVNTYLDKPAEGTPSDVVDVRENLFIAHKALLMRESFYGVSEGATTSFGINQQVLNTRYVVGEFGNKNTFKQMVTKGVVPNAYQLYMWGDNYLYRSFNKVNALDSVEWKDSANKLEENDFFDRFGHRSDKLTGYILNYDTVTDGTLEKVENGVYTFRFALDTTEATAYLRKEMVTNGNLNDYPTFAKAEIVVTMDAEWNVKTLTTDCEYTAKTMGITARCSEDITETFYEFEGDLPEKDFFEQFFDADYSDVDQEKGALDVLLDMFSPYLNGEDLQVALAVNSGDTQFVNALVSISGLDISDLSKLSVSAKIGNALDVAYEHGQSKIYLKYQDFQASTTVEGILGLVDTILPLLGDDGSSIGDAFGDLDVDGLLANLTYEISDDGKTCTVSLPLSLAGLEIDAKLYADVDGETYTFTNAVVKLGDVEITLAPQAWSVEERSGDYPDVTESIGTLLQPIIKLVKGESYGADFTLNLAVGANTYLVKGSVAYDLQKTLSANATVYDGNVGILDANVIYANDTVYLTVNGIKVAFAVDSGSATDVGFAEAISQLLANEQIASLLNSHEELNELLDKVMEIVGVVNNFELSQLLNVDFTKVLTRLALNDGKLSLSLDGSELGFDGLAVDVTLANDGGDLAVGVSGLQLANVGLSLAATVTTDVETIELPVATDYYLNLHGIVNISGVTLDLEITADLINFDVWATAQIYNEVIYLRYVGGVVYVQFGNVKVKLDTTDLDEIINKFGGLLGGKELSLDGVDINEILSALSFNLTDEAPCITFALSGIEASVNFNNVDGVLSFANIYASLGDGKFDATLELNGGQATQLDVEGEFVDGNDLARTFADSILELVNAQNYAFSINGKVALGSNVYTVDANVSMSGGNVYANFKLALGKANMLEGQLWLVDRILYLEIGDLRFSVAIPEKSGSDKELTLEDVKETLTQLTGYNTHLDDLVELALNVLDTQIEDVKLSELLFRFALENGNLILGVDGSQFGLSQFELALGVAQNGVQFALSSLSYKDVSVDLNGRVSSFTDVITAPSGDFTTNLKVIIDEHNTLYANIDLMNKVIKLQLESRANNGKITKLDILYTLTDNIIKITNGHNLYVSADINNIVDIIKEIDDIVNEFAGADAANTMSGLASLASIDLKAILSTLKLSAKGSKAELTLSALGLDLTVIFAGGSLESVILPVTDGLTLTVKTEPNKADYADFPEDVKYVRIDEVFNDYFYGHNEGERGAIDALIHTNSWKFDFNSDSEITITNDNGTADKYQIVAGSYFVFYYNKTDAQGFKLRAKLTINKFDTDRWKEFIILDVAYIDGRIYVNYDSNSKNSNVLKATVSVDAIKECINLLPSLYKVVPQLEDIVNNIKDAMSEAQGSLTLGNLASLFNEVTYNDEKVFTLSLNAGIFEGLGEIYLSAQQYGSEGLQLNQLRLDYNNISVNLNNIVVTASESQDNEDGSKSFEYVDAYILSYLSQHGGYGSFMNFDSIRELLAGFVITADNVDADGNRSFALQGTVHANMTGLAKVDIQIYVNVDIDKDNNVYLAVKIHRESATGLAGGLAYDDEGGDSYLLLSSVDQTITLARNSIQKRKWCSKCKGWSCSSTVLHTIYRSDKKVSDYDYKGSMSYLVEDLPLSDFAADTVTLVNYILELINFSSTIEKPIKDAIGKENTNVYGIEDILKSYSYSYDENKSQGTFAIGADLSPIDSALGAVTVNILHVGNFDDVYYDEDGIFHDGGGSVSLTQINGSATMIRVMDATFELNLVEPTTGLATGYVTGHNYMW